MRRDLGEGAWLCLVEGFVPADEATAALVALRDEAPWTQRAVTLFGRSHPQPRLTCWMGDVGYTYSGLRWPPTPWHPAARALRARVEDHLDARVHGALLNLYRDGDDAMGMHADDEPEIAPGSPIASVSLGATRRFVLRHKGSGAREELLLRHGDLLVMGGTMQSLWRHGIPRARRVREARVNLTLRQHRA
ncbi:MAG: alpha-ketoglutarate-dependent dioxygenase AlkB [Polyangiales bacterium]